MAEIRPTPRIRPSPFYEATLGEGVTGFQTYNQMLMPVGYGDPRAEYDRLINGVSLWDVAVERQVQLKGPDAGRLAQILCARDLSRCAVGQGKYAAICNHRGVVLNDPIVLKRSEDCYWLSIADSNVLFWASAVAAERRLDVSVTEPDVSPLAVQGPLADEVVASIFGDWVRDMKHFWFQETILEGIPLVVARSGWSKQGGFEIYLMDHTQGTKLWNLVREAGRPFGIGPGNPNPVERIESGLISWGSDTDAETNPFEIRMGRFVDLDINEDVIGLEALRQIKAEGPKRHTLGVKIDGATPAQGLIRWHRIERNGKFVGHLVNRTWSYRLEQNIGYALISRDCQVGDRITLHQEHGPVQGTLTKIPFL